MKRGALECHAQSDGAPIHESVIFLSSQRKPPHGKYVPMHPYYGPHLDFIIIIKGNPNLWQDF